MENIAHTLAGFALARTGLAARNRFATAALVLGSNAPDIDIVTLGGGTLTYVAQHRAITHSFVGATLLGIVLALLLVAVDRWIYPAAPPTKPARFGPLLGLSLLAVFGHLAFDLLNDYGIRLLLPFSQRWIYGDTIFIVDPWFWLILGGALLLGAKPGLLRTGLGMAGFALLSYPVLSSSASVMPAKVVWLLGLAAFAAVRLVFQRKTHDPAPNLATSAVDPDDAPQGSPHEALQSRRSRFVARAGLAVLAAYVAVCFVLHGLALERARAQAAGTLGGDAPARVVVIPRPTDPLHWNAFAERSDRTALFTVPALGPVGGSGPVRTFTRNLDRPEVQAALGTPVGQVAAHFCRFLFADVEPGDGGPTVIFRDARFASRGGEREFSIFVVAPDGRGVLAPRRFAKPGP